MSALSLTLLGPSQATFGSEPIPGFRTQKAQGLLIYLVVEPQIHSRDSIMELLWPDMPPDSARHNLRQALYYLRRLIPEVASRRNGDEAAVPLLLSGRQTIQLNPQADVKTDTRQFQLLYERSLQHEHSDLLLCPVCRQDLEGAAALYQGDFLADFYLTDSGPFEAWAVAWRAAFQRQWLDALQKLGRIYLIHGQYAAAEEVARKQIASDELRESAQRQLLEVLARTGRRNKALAHYDALRRHLWEELGVAPDTATVALIEQIEGGNLADPPAAGKNEPVVADDTQDGWPGFLIEDAAPDEEHAPFVARERELSRLQDALDAARDGRGQMLFVTGGAGRGKSMLMEEFARRAALADPGLLTVSGHCAAITGVADPYLPFREALAMLTGDVEAKWAAGLLTTQQARQLWNLMNTTLPAVVKHGPDLVNSVLSGQALLERAALAAPQGSLWRSELAALAERRQSSSVDQRQIFAQYAALLKAVASQHPLLLVIEDLHWVDTASSGLLFHLSREISNSSILLVGTYRPEEVVLGRSVHSSPGYGEPHALAGLISELKRQYGDIWLDLGDLGSREGRHFVDAYLDTRTNQLDETFRAALFRQTAGHALFTVELLHAMQERGDLRQDPAGHWMEGQAIDWTNLPLRVEGVIEHRIERLDEELHNILTVASLEGETFTAEALAAVLQIDQRQLIQRLSRELDKRHRLVTTHAMELLRPGRQRISIYRFRHQLFQQYLYHQLDEVERAYLHEAVGYALERLYAGQTREVAGKLAYHFKMAGLLALAIDYFQEAAEAAAAVYAYNEAVSHYTDALELAETGEMGHELLAQLHTRLGGLLLITRGDWAPEVGEAYSKAYELYRHGDDSLQRFAALRGLSMYYRMGGELAAGRSYAEELMFLAQRLHDPALIVEASFALGSLLYFSGEHGLAQTYLEQGINNYKAEHHQPLLYDQDPGVALLSYSSHNLWLLGYPDRALQHGHAAIALAQELAHPYSLAMALIWSGWTHIFRGETNEVRERSQEAIRLSAKHDFPVFAAVGTIQNGWALAREGQPEVGTAQMRQCLADSAAAVGLETAPAILTIHFAAIYPAYQDIENGLHVLDDALQYGGEGGHRLLEPELHRLQGELFLLRGEPDAEIEVLFGQALNLAREQQVRSLELRATMSLARFWQSREKTADARQLLQEIYSWFSEGLDTHDLQQAGKLLQELS